MSFGERPKAGKCAVRPSAFGLVRDGFGQLAVVHTGEGIFLPGGGIEAKESTDETIRREVLEDCGLNVRMGVWATHAVQFAYSEPERSHSEKRSTFGEGTIEGPGSTPSEADHKLVWVDPETAATTLSHPSHRWAVEQWRIHIARRRG